MKTSIIKVALLAVGAQAYEFEEFKDGVHTGMFMENRSMVDDYSCPDISQADKRVQMWMRSIYRADQILKMMKKNTPEMDIIFRSA